ncbi:MAG TPA: tachylectin-related carbohydrate-binding protein [Micromonospora sp.]
MRTRTLAKPGTGRWRGRIAVTLAAVLAAMPLVSVGEQPARAADTIVCGTPASVFAADSTGTLYLYPLNSPGSSTSTWSARKSLGTNWQTYGRLLGGPNGRLYGINNTGMYRYRWTGSAWELFGGVINYKISSSFISYAGAAYRDKITVDERGDFYLIDAAGKLRWFRYDEATKVWVINGQVLDTGWDRYDLIVAGGLGVLYARAAADGKIYRHRFEPTSQRWIVQNRQITSGWSTFGKGIFSVGGDTLFGIQGDGDLFQYRYREDDNTWPIVSRDIGNGWQNFTNVTASTNTCRLSISYVPAQPPTPLQQFTPTQVMQASSNMLEYAYTDNIGRLVHGRQDPDNFGSVQWTVLSGLDAFTGEPALSQNGTGLVQVSARNISSDTWSRTQASAGSPAWGAWSDLGGRMNSAPAVVRLSDGTQVTFALDAAGALWFRAPNSAGGDVLPWRKLGGSELTGPLSVVPVDDAAADLLAVDTAGIVWTARYRAGTLSTWVSLGGTGFTGKVSTVLMPGYRLRIFVRDTTGQIMTQQQDFAGVFPRTWTPVGSGFTAAGSPSALLSPVTGRIGVYARGGDGHVHYAGETAQGSGAWGTWILADGGFETYATDPTAFSYTGSNGPVVAYVVRSSDDQHRVYTVNESTALTAGSSSGRATGTTGGQPLFTRHELPAPPRR